MVALNTLPGEIVIETGDGGGAGDSPGAGNGGGLGGPIAAVGRAAGGAPMFRGPAVTPGGGGTGIGRGVSSPGGLLVERSGSALGVPGAGGVLVTAPTTVSGGGAAKSSPGGIYDNVAARFRMPIIYEKGLTDSNADPNSIPHLLERVARDTNIKAVTREEFVPLELTEIQDSPVTYFVGHAPVRFDEKHRDTLKKYVDQGGTIIGNNGHGPFDVAFQKEMRRLFKERLQPIPLSDPVYKSFYKLDRVPEGDLGDTYPLLGIKKNGRWAVIYCRNDYGECWEGKMPVKPEVREKAFQLGVNLYVYATAHWLKEHPQGAVTPAGK